MPYPKLDRSQLAIKKLSERKNKVYIEKDHVPVTQKPEISQNMGRSLSKRPPVESGRLGRRKDR